MRENRTGGAVAEMARRFKSIPTISFPPGWFGREGGSAWFEFAICMPMLALVFAGIIDYSLLIQQGMLVTQAAAAGAAYGAIYGNQNDTSGMATAARNAATGLSSFTVTANDIYTCTPGGATVTSTTICTGYGTPIKYVQVQTSAKVSPLLGIFLGNAPATNGPSLGGACNSCSVTVTGSATYRVRWTAS